MTLPIVAHYAVIVLAAIASFVALRLSQGLFAPLVLSIVVGIVLSPVAKGIDRLGVPRALGAVIGLGLILSLLVGLVLLLEPLVSLAFQQAPQLWFELRWIIADLQRGLAELDSMSEEMSRAINPQGPPAPSEESFTLPRITDALLYAPAVASQIMIFVGGLFFFLLSRNEIYDWAGRISTSRFAPGNPDGRGPLHTRLLQAERRVSHYFLTVSVINAVFGVVITVAFMAAGIPMAMMWGAVAMLLNFIPYVGPLVVAVMLALSGVVMFEGAQRFLPVMIYVSLNVLEGQFITPALVGQTLRVNPMAVFMSLVFWLWLWGPLGGFVAIPMLIWFLALTTDRPPAPEEVEG